MRFLMKTPRRFSAFAMRSRILRSTATLEINNLQAAERNT